MTTLPPKLVVLRALLAILSASSLAPAAAADLILRGVSADLAAPAEEALASGEGLLARERVEVDASVVASLPQTLWLELEPGERRLAVLVDSVRTPDGGLVWRGRFVDDPPEHRSIVLSLHGGLLRGSFEAGDIGYSLRPTPDGTSELLTLRADRELRCGVAAEAAGDVAHPATDPASLPGPAIASGDASAPRRIAGAADPSRTPSILVLVPPPLVERWGGRPYAVSYAHHAVDAFNTALANSRVDGAAFLAGVEEWLPSQREHARILREAQDDADVHALRARTGADLVAILTDRTLSSSSLGACGQANLMNAQRLGSQMASFAYSITAVHCDTHNHAVFVHELGHNLGGNHQPGGNVPSPGEAAFPYAYAHQDNTFASVMVSSGGSSRGNKLVFSNPTLVVDGVPAGIEGERDNARVLQQTIPIAAGFRSGGEQVPRERVPPPVPPPPIVVPGAPTDLRGAVLSATSVRLFWKDNTIDDIGYRIEMKEDGGGGFETADEVPGDTVEHVVEGLEPATSYRFRVLALGVQQNSSPSNEIRLTTRNAPPAAPAGLTALPNGPGAIVLDWDPVERATGYEVEVRTADPAGDRGAQPIALGADGAVVDGLEPATPYTLRVRSLGALGASEWSPSVSATTARADGPCVAGGTSLCLLGGRFEVRARWRNPHPPFGHGLAAAQAAPGSELSGFFTFFDPQNVELVVKMLDGRSVNDAFWTFYGALSDVEYWISVFDTTDGTSRTYHNEPFSLCGRGDTNAFPSPDPEVPAVSHAVRLSSSASPVSRTAAPASGACTPDEHALCLADGRFRVEVAWENPHAPDSRGVGSVFAWAGTDLTGHFWFFTPNNLELSVKILDARVINDHFWIFWGALSDVGYTLRITDTETGEMQELTNPPLTLCGGAVTDLL